MQRNLQNKEFKMKKDKHCRHKDIISFSHCQWCERCGALRYLDSVGEWEPRWVYPKILKKK